MDFIEQGAITIPAVRKEPLEICADVVDVVHDVRQRFDFLTEKASDLNGHSPALVKTR
jgi:hypothetical protein